MKIDIGITAAIVAMSASVAIAAPASAVGDALPWLSLLDRGAYAQSWTDAGSLFKIAITQTGWATSAANVRQPLGAVVSRTLAGEQDTDSLPGVPPGHYKILQFNTAFANKPQAVETVMLQQEPGGWKVDGYFIR
jgi:hypothetical protein